MKKTVPGSRMEIWGCKYINAPERRNDEDKNTIILQMEPAGNGGDYMVEVINKSEQEE